jgi:hypothetical protein
MQLLHKSQKLAGEAKSYAERLFEFPRIESLTDAQAADALCLPAEELGVKFEVGAVEEIVRASKGYPYFLQEWGYHVWNAAPDTPITSGDVRVSPLGWCRSG